MNRAKSISIHHKTRMIKSVLDFQVAGRLGAAGQKDRVKNVNVRVLSEQELDLVVGRSIN